MLQGLFQTEAGNLGFPTSIITKVKGGGLILLPGEYLQCLETFSAVTAGGWGDGCRHVWHLVGRDQ